MTATMRQKPGQKEEKKVSGTSTVRNRGVFRQLWRGFSLLKYGASIMFSAKRNKLWAGFFFTLQVFHLVFFGIAQWDTENLRMGGPPFPPTGQWPFLLPSLPPNPNGQLRSFAQTGQKNPFAEKALPDISTKLNPKEGGMEGTLPLFFALDR